MKRRYARAPRGERAEVTEVFRTGGNISVISALTLRGVHCSMMIEGAINTDVLNAYVRQMLAPELRRGDIVIWDNAPPHKNAQVIALIESTGASVVALPAYSPDLNPKEECISKIKSALRSAGAETTLLLQRALKRAIESVTSQDIRGWFRHCGYNVA
jgi:transposase